MCKRNETVLYLFYKYIAFLLRHLITFSLIRGRETFSERVGKEDVRAKKGKPIKMVYRCISRGLMGLHLQNNNNNSFLMEC